MAANWLPAYSAGHPSLPHRLYKLFELDVEQIVQHWLDMEMVLGIYSGQISIFIRIATRASLHLGEAVGLAPRSRLKWPWEGIRAQGIFSRYTWVNKQLGRLGV